MPSFHGLLTMVLNPTFEAARRAAFTRSPRHCWLAPASLRRAPTIRQLGLLAGYEYRRGGSSVRALLGPTAFTSPGHTGVGARANASAAVGGRHLAVTAGLSVSWLTFIAGAPYRYYVSAFGLRLQ